MSQMQELQVLEQWESDIQRRINGVGAYESAPLSWYRELGAVRDALTRCRKTQMSNEKN